MRSMQSQRQQGDPDEHGDFDKKAREEWELEESEGMRIM